MKFTGLLLSILISLMSCSNNNEIICNEFDVHAELVEGDFFGLNYFLSTDLPGETLITVSVTRSYWVSGEEYSVEYYTKSTTVDNIKNKSFVPIEESLAISEVRRHQEISQKMGQPFNLTEISNSIELSILVPLQEELFGHSNEKLIGTMVSMSELSGIYIIEKAEQFHLPFPKELNAFLGKYAPSLSPRNLDIAVLYRLSEKTPVWQKNDPNFHNNLIYLPPGSVIKIISREVEEISSDYEIESNYYGKKVTGWIASTALWGQTLTVVKDK